MLVSVQLAYKFGELVEVHAADTYAEFVEANEVRPVMGQCSSTASRASTNDVTAQKVDCYVVISDRKIHTIYPTAGPAQEAAASRSGSGILQGELCQRNISWLDVPCCVCCVCDATSA